MNHIAKQQGPFLEGNRSTELDVDYERAPIRITMRRGVETVVLPSLDREVECLGVLVCLEIRFVIGIEEIRKSLSLQAWCLCGTVRRSQSALDGGSSESGYAENLGFT